MFCCNFFKADATFASVICFKGDSPFPYAIFPFTIGISLEATLHLCINWVCLCFKIGSHNLHSIVYFATCFEPVFRSLLTFHTLFSSFSTDLTNIYEFKKQNERKATDNWEQHNILKTLAEWLHIFMLHHFLHFANCMPSFGNGIRLPLHFASVLFWLCLVGHFYTRDK